MKGVEEEEEVENRGGLVVGRVEEGGLEDEGWFGVEGLGFGFFTPVIEILGVL